jgi:ATP-dependent DNA helicase RecQ
MMLFSVIQATGQMFGAAHIIDVLVGSGAQKITERGHDRLRAHGAGAAMGREYWQSFIRQAVAGNHLVINLERYGALQIAPRGRAVIAGEESFALRRTQPGKPARTPRQRSGSRTVPEGDASLLATLKKLRLEFARARNVPAYVVFPDATLIEMARARPSTLGELSGIGGVGPRKLEDFGQAFLGAIVSHVVDRAATPSSGNDAAS